MVQGLDSVPADERPTIRQVNVVHLAWDIMVGLGTLLFLLTLWYWASWIFRRDMPRSPWFLRCAAASGVLAVLAMEAGWVVSEVGRQPWIVYNKMKVEDAATANTGVWITFIAVGILYVGLGITTVLVLRGMSRRTGGRHASRRPTSPYGPARARRAARGADQMSTTAAVLLFSAVTIYSIFGGADFGAGSGTSSLAVRNEGGGPARSSTTRSDPCGKRTMCG